MDELESKGLGCGWKKEIIQDNCPLGDLVVR